MRWRIDESAVDIHSILGARDMLTGLLRETGTDWPPTTSNVGNSCARGVKQNPLVNGEIRGILIAEYLGQGEIMSEFQGSLRMGEDSAPPMDVTVDLTDDRMRLTAGDVEVADWAREEFRIQALTDGFHVRAEGEEVVLDISDDARFAIELGLRSAHPALRRRMSALMRDDD